MKASVDCQFRFNDIGQGLFYSGKLDNSTWNYSFIYDCGTLSKQEYVKEAIREVTHGLQLLDLLVISHLDYDHVSGLEALLNSVSVNTVILPYMKPIERLALYTKNIGSYHTTEYYKFLEDPVGYLINHKVERIILLKGEDSAPHQSVDRKDMKSESNKPINLYFEDSETLLNEIRECEPNITRFENVLFKKHDGCLIVYRVWQFRFFNQPSNEENLCKFTQSLNDSKLDVSTHEKILELLKDEDKREKLKNSYTKIFSKINLTSIVMYHGPIGDEIRVKTFFSKFSNSRVPYFDSPRYNSHDYISEEENYYGTVLFGDTNLSYKIDNILMHFGALLQSILVVSTPHHGSKHSWNEKILTEINDFSFWIISAGLHSRFRHPHAEVIFQLEGEAPNKILLMNNEHNGILIHSRVSCG